MRKGFAARIQLVLLSNFCYNLYMFAKLKNFDLKSRLPGLILPGIIIAVLLTLDLVTKGLIQSNMDRGDSVVIINDFLYFTYVLNNGAAFSLFDGGAAMPFFIVLTTIALIFFILLLLYKGFDRKIAKVSLALIIAGTLGNYIDRIYLGAVRDFIQIVYFGLDIPLLGESFAIFNVADACLSIGIVIFAIYYIFIFRFPEEDPKKLAAELKAQGVVIDDEPADKADGGDKTNGNSSP